MASRTATTTRRRSTTPAAPTTTPTAPTATRLTTAPSSPHDGPDRRPGGADPALDEALERISDLAARLWAVRSAHRPVAVGWLRPQTRCAGCGQPAPCATLLAAG